MRPKQSVIYGATHDVLKMITENHVPQNFGICANESEVAAQLGTFLLDKNIEKKFAKETTDPTLRGPGGEIERRRSHRMHVALPMEIKIIGLNQQPVVTTSIATNISEGGIFAEYLDLEAADKIEAMGEIVDSKAHVHIFPSTYFPGEFDIVGMIRRKQLVGKQLGLAIEFIA